MSAGSSGRRPAFGSRDVSSAQLRSMENVFRMNMTSLGPFMLKEGVIPTQEGMHACQDYGKSIAKML